MNTEKACMSSTELNKQDHSKPMTVGSGPENAIQVQKQTGGDLAGADKYNATGINKQKS